MSNREDYSFLPPRRKISSSDLLIIKVSKKGPAISAGYMREPYAIQLQYSIVQYWPFCTMHASYAVSNLHNISIHVTVDPLPFFHPPGPHKSTILIQYCRTSLKLPGDMSYPPTPLPNGKFHRPLCCILV